MAKQNQSTKMLAFLLSFSFSTLAYGHNSSLPERLDVAKTYSALIKDIQNSKNANQWDEHYHELQEFFNKPQLSDALCSHLKNLQTPELEYLEGVIEHSTALDDQCKDALREKVEYANSWSMEEDFLKDRIKKIKKIPFEVREVPDAPLLHLQGFAPKEIMLTFDDGPVTKPTTYVLEALKAAGVKAAFFSTGKCAQTEINKEKKNPGYISLTKRILQEGHVLASHSYGHTPAMGTKLDKGTLSKDFFMSEFVGGHYGVYQSAGYIDPFFRFPNGDMNQWTQSVVNSAGIKIFQWMIDTEDWIYNVKDYPDMRSRNKAMLEKFVATLSQRRKDKSLNNRGIMLMHDIQMTSAAALPDILDYLATNGYKIILLKPKSRNLNNPGHMPVISEVQDYFKSSRLSPSDLYPVTYDKQIHYNFRSRFDFDLMFGR